MQTELPLKPDIYSLLPLRTKPRYKFSRKTERDYGVKVATIRHYGPKLGYFTRLNFDFISPTLARSVFRCLVETGEIIIVRKDSRGRGSCNPTVYQFVTAPKAPRYPHLYTPFQPDDSLAVA